ncbi:MAG TPA: c-type cytochrome domain-containing protein, partial [Bryobacteraceae bacterium]|nr:c-type cytochrome domain-containing protein [Bryobacteraceae bacterium]
MRNPFPAGAFVCVALLASLNAPAQTKVDFAGSVAPILEQQCLACHSAAKAAGGLAITGRQALLDRKVLTPGKPEASTLYTRAALPSTQPGAMPPGGPRLPDDQLAVLKNWIAQGAEWPASVTFRDPASLTPADEHDTVRRIRQR